MFDTRSTGRLPKRSAAGPASQRPRSTGEQHDREEEVAVPLGVADRHLPQRHERDQPEPRDAAHGDDAEQQGHRAEAILPRRRPRLVTPRRHERQEERDEPQQHGRDDEARDDDERAALHAERDDDRRRDDDARASSRGCRRSRRATCRSRVSRRLRTRRTSSPRGGTRPCRGLRRRRRGRPTSSSATAPRAPCRSLRSPRRRAAATRHPADLTRGRTAAARRSSPSAEARMRPPAYVYERSHSVDEERQQRGQHAAGEVDGHVPGRERGHRASIDVRARHDDERIGAVRRGRSDSIAPDVRDRRLLHAAPGRDSRSRGHRPTRTASLRASSRRAK